MAKMTPNCMRTINVRTKEFSGLKSKWHKQQTTPMHEFKFLKTGDKGKL